MVHSDADPETSRFKFIMWNWPLVYQENCHNKTLEQQDLFLFQNFATFPKKVVKVYFIFLFLCSIFFFLFLT